MAVLENRPWFDSNFRGLTGESPFPWQRVLYEKFLDGDVPGACDIPTGLGKTSVMVIWLLARANSVSLPRRLVYVVDRRAVVDQATEVAMKLRDGVNRSSELKTKLKLEGRSLPISTLRGQHADNRAWLEDPSTPAIIVGTVDMVGSRLLFEGYGTSRKMRPYHAGLMGVDTLVVLDESHLVPAFEGLLQTIADGLAAFGPRENLRELVPPFKFLSMSATGRSASAPPFGLQSEDLHHAIVKLRLDAPKRLEMLALEEETKLEDALARQAWRCTAMGSHATRFLVFCDKREVAAKAKVAIEALAKGDQKSGCAGVEITTELLVGGRRVFERQRAAGRLKDLGFIAGAKLEPKCPTFLFATSAGEVGIDLDADHMACDLVAWERMVQRLGRVNRRGEGDATVVVVAEPEPKTIEDARQKAASERTAQESREIESVEQTRAVC